MTPQFSATITRMHKSVAAVGRLLIRKMGGERTSTICNAQYTTIDVEGGGWALGGLAGIPISHPQRVSQLIDLDEL